MSFGLKTKLNMSQISEYDFPLLRREVVPWGVGRDTSGVLPLQNAIFNDRFVVEPPCGFRDNLSVRSLGALSPFYRSRPDSPISERDPVAWALNLSLSEYSPLAEAPLEPLTPTTNSSRQLPLYKQQTENLTPSQGARVDAGVQTFDVCLRFPKTGRRQLPKTRKRKAKSLEIPREEAERELLSSWKPSTPPTDHNLRSKICKVRSFWNRTNKALPTTFKVSYLCPVKKQSEFLDFSRKEILLDDSPTNDILFKSGPADDSVSYGGSIQSPWADDFDQGTFAN